MSFLDYQNAISRINKENQDLENNLADRKRMKAEMKEANKKKRKLQKQAYRDIGVQAIRDQGYAGPVLVILNKKNQQVGYVKDGKVYASVNGPAGQPNLMPPNVASRNVKQSWTLPDCAVQEVPMGTGAKCFDVYMKRGGHTRVQRLYPLSLEEEEAVIKALKNGASPVANAWDDGRGVPISWENATPMGGPRAGSKSSKCIKKKPTDKPKPKQTSQANSCIKKKQKLPQKPASKPAQPNQRRKSANVSNNKARR